MTTKTFQPTIVPGLRSPYDEVGGLVYFSRMISKIRLNAEGKLGADYQENLGAGFDARCVRLLGVDYEELKTQALDGDQSNEVLLEWCFQNGRRLTAEEIEVWNGFLIKRGWRDSAHSVLVRRLTDAGLADDGTIETMFDFLDFDEGRPLRQRP